MRNIKDVEHNMRNICKEKFCHDKNKKNEYVLPHKVRDPCHYIRNLEELLIIFAN